jgi:aryl-alcohol dehydrogenase-like predicted oxidoreductase
MEYRRVGSSGLKVSAVGLGCNNFGMRCDEAQTKAVVHKALDLGVTLFDTADIYGNRGGSETLLGKALGDKRKDIVLATKFGGPMGDSPLERGASRRYVHRALDASLRRLGTDWIDLYQLHTPDPKTPIEETLAALSELVSEGKVRYLGSSNLSGWQVVDADWTARGGGFEQFISAQNEYSWLDRSAEKELIPALEHTGQSLLPYFPLARGLLTGKYRRGESAPLGTRLVRQSEVLQHADFDTVEALQSFADERGITMLQLAIGGLAARPTVGSVIAGATSVDQVWQNVAAGLWEPTADDLDRLLELTG